MALEDDLYKALLEESKLYREKVSTIWLQKFTLLGAVIGFAVAQSRLTTGENPNLIVAAILSLPIIAILLDIKLGEFGIHANVIDHFVKRHYPEPAVLGEWELTNWGLGSDSADRRLIRIRSILTVAVSVLPTCIIAVLSGFAINSVPGFSAPGWTMPLALGFCAVYIAAGFGSIPFILFRQ